MLIGRAFYRCGQFFKALEERRAPLDQTLLDRHLGSAARLAFEAMSTRDRVHAIRTAIVVCRRTEGDADLVVAALLHDVGKGRQMLWHRVAYILLATASPGLLHRLARTGGGWRGALARSLDHPRIGGALARSLGCSEGVTQLIEEHHRASEDVRLRLLQWADEVA